MALPAVALSASVNSKIPDGYYATVLKPHVPGGADVEFTLRHHADLGRPSLTCSPNPKVASENAASGYAQVLNYAQKRVTLNHGGFSYSGSAKVTAAYGGAPQIATAKLVIKGKYVPHGKTYHYTGSLRNKVSATLIFEGTASSTACTSAKAQTFRLYHTVSSGGA